MKVFKLFFFFLFTMVTVNGQSSPMYPDNEFSIQTMNASNRVTTFELKPLGSIYSLNGCQLSPISSSTVSLQVIGDLICSLNGFEYRFPSESDNIISTSCSPKEGHLGPIRNGFYKLNIYVDGVLKTHLYYDSRTNGFPESTCNEDCSGNVMTIRYDATNNLIRFYNSKYLNLSEQYMTVIPEGTIISVMQNKSCNIGSFQPFWNTGLVVVSKVNGSGPAEPYLIWGPYSDFQPTGYKIYYSINTTGGGPGNYNLLAMVGPEVTSYIHEGLAIGSTWKVYYKVKAYNSTQESNYTNVAEIGAAGFFKTNDKFIADITIENDLLQNNPNPFNPTTQINYSIKEAGHVSLGVYDLLGRSVTELVNEYKNPGQYSVTFDATGLSNGIYFYALSGNNYNRIKKMAFVK